jgi:CO/xanthine dehydrogenase Mo-binding subunit
VIDRRQFLAGGGALVVAFGLPAGARGQAPTAAASLDAWLAVGADGAVTVFCGKVELGTGVETALAQIVAEELDVAVARVTMVLGDTWRTPNQGPTVGSKTLQLGGPPLRQAAAAARQTLLELAAARLGSPVERLVVRDGVVMVEGESRRRLGYGELIGGRRFNRAVPPRVAVKPPDRYHVVGTSARRVDIPGKVRGTHLYVQNVRVPGMLHGRVVRPPAVGATLASVDEASIRAIPGARVVVRGNFVGVVAEREELAIRAARALRVTWTEGAGLPATDVYEAIRSASTTDRVLRNKGDVTAALGGARHVQRATYQTPFQMHASIGPSCAVADVRPGQTTIWSGTQGAWGLRDAIAQLLGVPPEGVRVIWVEASGCYGHNGADDAAADAALLSAAVGRPVRVQWMRHDEHGWEPKGPAMVVDVRAALDAAGAVLAWDYAVRTPTHSTRPGGEGGNLLAGQLVGLRPRAGLTGGERNAEHPYAFANDRVTVRWQSTSRVRPSALRGLGAPQNTYANESFMDELAAAAQVDPIEFRLRHLTDPRATAVIEAVAKLARWTSRPSPAPRAESDGPARGRGVAYARYENRNAYVAVVTEVAVHRGTGAVRVVRVWVAHDCGLVVNPDGVRNQIEGNVLQTVSRALKEEVAFDRRGVTSLDWTSYPILTFSEAPESVEITLIDRPDQPAVGAGEPAACPVPAAIANAIFDAVGARVRTMPFTADRVRKALA